MAEQLQRACDVPLPFHEVLLGLSTTVVGISGLRDGHGIKECLIKIFPWDWYMDSREKKLAFSVCFANLECWGLELWKATCDVLLCAKLPGSRCPDIGSNIILEVFVRVFWIILIFNR